MSTVMNLGDIDEYLKFMTSFLRDKDGRIKNWMVKKLRKEVVNNKNHLVLVKIDANDQNFDEHVRKAMEKGEEIFKISFKENAKMEIRHVLDWIDGLEQRDSILFSKIDRITWKQAVEHSNRWHEALARRAEKSSKKKISFDENCPVVYEHDDGMKWVWLKTDKARDDEGNVMGHCVGSGGYDDLGQKEAVFSLRDAEGRPHVTMEVDEIGPVQIQAKGNSKISEKYEGHVGVFIEFICKEMKRQPKKEGVDHIVWWNGDEEWYLDGGFHREDGPAVQHVSGSREWWVKGKRHRLNGPAVELADGTREWYKRGKLHCLKYPAVERSWGEMQWLKDGKFHRIDGPAIKWGDGTEEWYRNGYHHREDGPAIIYSNGDKEWWVDGKKTHEIREGLERWFDEDGLKHREDGPAAIYPNGDEEWYRHGLTHREDGPAVILKNEGTRTEMWYCNEKIHRVNGPAIIHANGDEEWYLNGKKHREGGPAVKLADGTREWWVNDERHRDDGPAIIHADGNFEWYRKGHRCGDEELDELKIGLA